jgi:hypothetical protein
LASKASRPIWSPARAATWASISTVLSAWSIWARPSLSAVISRPQSSRHTTVWFRSCWYSRTIRRPRRAVAFQSMFLYSSSRWIFAQALELVLAAAQAHGAHHQVLAALAREQLVDAHGRHVGVHLQLVARGMRSWRCHSPSGDG